MGRKTGSMIRTLERISCLSGDGFFFGHALMPLFSRFVFYGWIFRMCFVVFSLGTNPRGVKDSYTLVTIVMWLRLFFFSFLCNIVVAIV